MDGNDSTATLSLSDWRLISPLTLVVGSALAGWIAGAVLKRALSLKRRDELSLRLYGQPTGIVGWLIGASLVGLVGLAIIKGLLSPSQRDTFAGALDALHVAMIWALGSGFAVTLLSSLAHGQLTLSPDERSRLSAQREATPAAD